MHDQPSIWGTVVKDSTEGKKQSLSYFEKFSKIWEKRLGIIGVQLACKNEIFSEVRIFVWQGSNDFTKKFI